VNRLIAALILFSVAAFAQLPSLAGYTAFKETTGTTEKVTIQQPASGSRRVRFAAAYVYCSVACDVNQSRNGTAASSTSLTPAKLNPADAGTAAATAWHTSNVGSGTTISTAVTLSAGASQTFDLNGLYMYADGTSNNYTISVTGTSSGTIRVAVKWYEE
jgi:hypothetical protein